MPCSPSGTAMLCFLRHKRILCLTALAVSGFSPELSAETVHFQLRWHHQFQFAGYYAAAAKGFYKEEGLDVVIREGSPGRTPVAEVLAGNAQYGEANSELLYERLHGKPLIALAVIFQHSPSVLLARKDSGISSPHDLIGKRIMMIGDVTDADFIAMFQNEGISPDSLNILSSTYEINDLASGKTDAFNSYLTNEPFFLKERGIPYTVINPSSYGIDFYSDIIFTTESEIENNPERVRKFLRATLKGWKYAMENTDEIIDILIRDYGVKKSRAHLQYEAQAMRKLILPDLVEIGHMNPGRWEHMKEIFIRVKMAPPGASLEGFLYDPEGSENYETLINIIYGLSIASALAFLVTGSLLFMYRKMQKEVQLRRAAEEEVRHLAFYDALTGLPNRHLLYDRINTAIQKADRYKEKFALCYLDLDNFKPVNDRYGHSTGDRYLAFFAKSAKEKMRESDTIARIGGDEFVILLERIRSREEVKSAAEKFLRDIASPVKIDGKEFQFKVSIGIAIYPDNGSETENLLVKADQAMYQVKKAGKGNLRFA